MRASTPPLLPPAPSGVTQTQRARDAMTPRTSELLPDVLLDARIGKGTFAGALNDQIRFRVQRDGADVPDWKLVPDSPLAAAIVDTRAGANLLQQLYVGVRSTGTKGDVSNLQGIILPMDAEAAKAADMLSWIDNPRLAPVFRPLIERGDEQAAGAALRTWSRPVDGLLTRAGAWNSDGWITYAPDMARATLAAAGAYDPHRSRERSLRAAGEMGSYLARVHPHEVQHSVSGPSPTAYQGAAKWMEEGTADVMAYTPVFHSRNRRDAGLDAASYAGRLAHEPAFDLGWKPYRRPGIERSEQEQTKKDADRNYGGGQATLTDLVKLAGADFRSTAGQARVFDLLQSKSMRYTPGVLAKAIIEQHGLDPQVYDRLRERIKVAVDLPRGAADIAAEFGID